MSEGPEQRVVEAVAIVDQMGEQGATARILGGVGIVLHCRHTEANGFHREPEDIDLAIPRAASTHLGAVLEARGYSPNARFNALHGDRRRIFQGPAGKLDVFVGSFTMCHRLELEPRLGLESPTLSASDLVLTKLQIVELTEKDLLDLRLLLEHHEVGSGPGDWIDAGYIAAVLADDWGYWRTASGTLERVSAAAPHLSEKTARLWQRVEDQPKSRRFKMRAKVGERRRWYELPETIDG
jgi:hypothetical protein